MANRFLSFSFTLMRRFGYVSELIFRASVMLGSSDTSADSISDGFRASAAKGRKG